MVEITCSQLAVCLHFVAVIIRFPWFDIRSSFLFANLIVTIVVLGGLLATIEKHLPTAIRQTFRYDKHALKGSSVRLVSLLEILKANTFTNKHCGKHSQLSEAKESTRLVRSVRSTVRMRIISFRLLGFF